MNPITKLLNKKTNTDIWGPSGQAGGGAEEQGLGGNAAAGVGMNLAGAGALGGMRRMAKKPGFSLFSKKPKATNAPPRPSTPAPALPLRANDSGEDEESQQIIYQNADEAEGGAPTVYKNADQLRAEPQHDAYKNAGAHDADDTEISEDEPETPTRAKAAKEFEARKQRRDNGQTKPPAFDPALGYAPKKNADTRHWRENEDYFINSVKAETAGLGVPTRTKYYNDEERAQHGVGVNGDGLLTGANGQLLDTQSAKAPMAIDAKAGRHIFAMSHDNEMYSADAIGENEASKKKIDDWQKGGMTGPKPEYRDMTHHSSFLEGKAVDEFGFYNDDASKGVKGAGEIDVKEGWLKKISNVSGHYQPDIKNTAATVKGLEEKGVNTDASKVENLTVGTDGSKKTDEYMARAVAATGGDTKLLDAHKSAFGQIAAGNVALKPTPQAAASNAEPWWKEAYRNKEE